jgi:heme exporter protein A
MTAISVQGLTKRFGPKIILRKLDFEVTQGEFVALLGPNGAGKTTLLRILASLSGPTFGAVKIAGLALPAQSTAVRRRLGIVLHHPLLYGDLSASENLMFYARMYGIAQRDQRIQDVLEMVGLATRSKDLVRTFSRGMQQRLSIGRATLHDPEILLMDEPYTGLDQDAAAMLDEVLLQVAGQGRTVVMTSHNLVRAERLASRFDVLSRGRVAASTAKADLPQAGLARYYADAVADG